MVISSFRNASATGGIRSASLILPYYVALWIMCLCVWRFTIEALLSRESHHIIR